MSARATRPDRFTLADVRGRTYKRRDAWWTVFLVDPLASRLVVFTANHTRLTPNQLTVTSLFFGLGAAEAFWEASRPALIVGALLYHVSFVFDCMDGKVARLKGSGSLFGTWLDYIFDRLRVLACSLALMSGQYRVTDDVIYLYLAFLVMFLDMLRYMDALQVYKIRQRMTTTIMEAREETGTDVAPLPAEPDEDEVGRPEQVVDLQRQFKSRFGWYLRVRDQLERWRVRPHLFSGIEYQMFIFIVAPIAGAIRETVVVSSVLLFVFELAIIYKLWLSTKDLTRQLKKLQHRAVPPVAGEGEDRINRQAHG